MLNPVSNSTKKYNFKCSSSSADNSDQFQDNSQNSLIDKPSDSKFLTNTFPTSFKVFASLS